MKRTRGNTSIKKARKSDKKRKQAFMPVKPLPYLEQVSRKEQREALNNINNVSDVYSLSQRYVISQPAKHPQLLEMARNLLPYDELCEEYKDMVDYKIEKKINNDSSHHHVHWKYNPDVVVAITACLMCGVSKTSLCLHTGVYDSDIRRWMKDMPVFTQCMEYANELYQACWEELGKNNIHNDAFNNGQYIFQITNRFKGKWHRNGEPSSIKLDVDNRKTMVINNTIQVQKTRDQLSNLGFEELKVLEKVTNEHYLEEAIDVTPQ